MDLNLNLNLTDIIEQLRPNTAPVPLCRHLPDHRIGPMVVDRGSILHQVGVSSDAADALQDRMAPCIPASVQFSIAGGRDPRYSLICPGYAGRDTGRQCMTDLPLLSPRAV